MTRAIVGAITAVLQNDPRGSEWPHYSREWRAAEEAAKWGAAIGATLGFIFRRSAGAAFDCADDPSSQRGMNCQRVSTAAWTTISFGVICVRNAEATPPAIAMFKRRGSIEPTVETEIKRPSEPPSARARDSASRRAAAAASVMASRRASSILEDSK